jgi:hypothetical protein
MLPWMIDDAGRRPVQMSLIEWPWPPSKPAVWCMGAWGCWWCDIYYVILRQASWVLCLFLPISLATLYRPHHTISWLTNMPASLNKKNTRTENSSRHRDLVIFAILCLTVFLPTVSSFCESLGASLCLPKYTSLWSTTINSRKNVLWNRNSYSSTFTLNGYYAPHQRHGRFYSTSCALPVSPLRLVFSTAYLPWSS